MMSDEELILCSSQLLFGLKENDLAASGVLHRQRPYVFSGFRTRKIFDLVFDTQKV